MKRIQKLPRTKSVSHAFLNTRSIVPAVLLWICDLDFLPQLPWDSLYLPTNIVNSVNDRNAVHGNTLLKYPLRPKIEKFRWNSTSKRNTRSSNVSTKIRYWIYLRFEERWEMSFNYFWHDVNIEYSRFSVCRRRFQRNFFHLSSQI